MAKRGLDKVVDFEDVSGVTRAVLCISRSRKFLSELSLCTMRMREWVELNA